MEFLTAQPILVTSPHLLQISAPSVGVCQLLNLCSCSDSSRPVCACLKLGERELCPQCAAGQTGTDSDGHRAGERPYTCVTSGPEPVYLPGMVKDTQGIPPYSTVPVIHSPFS